MEIIVLILVAIDCIAAAYFLCRWLSKKQKSLLKKDIEWAMDMAYDKFCANKGQESYKFCPYCGKQLPDEKAGSCPSCGRTLPRAS